MAEGGGMRRRTIPDRQITQVEAKAQLARLLYGCRPEKLAEYTVDGLARMYRVAPREIEYALTIARQKRAGEMR